jgi:hypothetical protein
MQRLLAASAALLFSLVPALASAATVEELRAKLLERVFFSPALMNDLAHQLADAIQQESSRPESASANPAPPAAPVVTHVAIVGQQSINVHTATDQLRISISTTDDQSGLRTACFNLMSPQLADGRHQYRSFCADTPVVAKNQDLVFISPQRIFDLYAAPGLWKLYDVTVYDRGGLYHDYSAGGPTGNKLEDVAGDLGIQVANGTPDTTVPTFVSGRILSPALSLSARYPVLRLSLTTNDDKSGAAIMYVYAAPDNGGPSRSFYIRFPNLGFGSAQRADLNFATTAETSLGSWKITGVDLYDYAGNDVYISDPAQLDTLFTTGRGFDVSE